MRSRGRKRRELRGPVNVSNVDGNSAGVEKPRPEYSYQDFYPDFDPETPLTQICVHYQLDADQNGEDEDTANTQASAGAKDRSKHTTPPTGVRLITDSKYKDFYVDRSMAAMGYQETDEFEMPEAYIRSEPVFLHTVLDNDLGPNPGDRNMLGLDGIRVEYDMDIQDREFLKRLNQRRVDELSVPEITPEVFEITMTLFETEWFKIEKMMPPKHKTSALEELSDNNDEQKCSICDEAECDNSNAIVFCDGCDVAVHQECYGVPFIPEGQWLCRQCAISRRRRASCVFCPNKSGALKQTESQHWAHMLCALWIPEVTIQNSAYLEPITGLDRIPKGRWKLNCYICKQKVGACIQCAHKNCYQSFHPTCARKARLCLKMSAGVQGGLYDPRTLMAFCDKHTPEEHAETVDIYSFLKEAKEHYANILDKQRIVHPDFNEINVVRETKIVRVTKPGVIQWKTEQGTPAIPNITVQKIVNMLAKFSIQRLKEYVWELARYWTCKKQYRRGATLTKRLQLALEALPTENYTRQNLEKKLKAYELALSSLERLQFLMADIQEREKLKLEMEEANLRIANMAIFPLGFILEPVWERIKESCDKTNIFNTDVQTPSGVNFDLLRERVEDKYYDSIGSATAFLEDVETYFSSVSKEFGPGVPEHRAAERILRFIRSKASSIQASCDSLKLKSNGLPDLGKVGPQLGQSQQARKPLVARTRNLRNHVGENSHNAEEKDENGEQHQEEEEGSPQVQVKRRKLRSGF